MLIFAIDLNFNLGGTGKLMRYNGNNLSLLSTAIYMARNVWNRSPITFIPDYSQYRNIQQFRHLICNQEDWKSRKEYIKENYRKYQTAEEPNSWNKFILEQVRDQLPQSLRPNINSIIERIQQPSEGVTQLKNKLYLDLLVDPTKESKSSQGLTSTVAQWFSTDPQSIKQHHHTENNTQWMLNTTDEIGKFLVSIKDKKVNDHNIDTTLDTLSKNLQSHSAKKTFSYLDNPNIFELGSEIGLYGESIIDFKTAYGFKFGFTLEVAFPIMTKNLKDELKDFYISDSANSMHPYYDYNKIRHRLIGGFVFKYGNLAGISSYVPKILNNVTGVLSFKFYYDNINVESENQGWKRYLSLGFEVNYKKVLLQAMTSNDIPFIKNIPIVGAGLELFMSNSTSSYTFLPKYQVNLLYAQRPIILFEKISLLDSVKGLNHVMPQIKDFISIMQDFSQYKHLNIQLPKGILLYGPPGTGKTFLVKALAGTLKTGFLQRSSSEFIGSGLVGVQKLQLLFKEASKKAPCIIFMDEIEALCRKRQASTPDSQLIVINAFLELMDGFVNSGDIVVLGTTNNINDIDPAFLRPGRFDRKFYIGLPNKEGRIDLLNQYMMNRKCDKNINVNELADMLRGISGASVKLILNDAAMIAKQRYDKEVQVKNNILKQQAEENKVASMKNIEHNKSADVKNMQEQIIIEPNPNILFVDIEEAADRVIMGGIARKIENYDLKLLSYRLAAHVIASYYLKSNQHIYKATILGRDAHNGMVAELYNDDMSDKVTYEELLARLQILASERWGEALYHNDENKISIASENQIKEMTQLAINIVNKYGFDSELSTFNYDPNAPQVIENAHKLVVEANKKIKDFLKINQHKINAIADQLLKKETLSYEDIDTILSKLK